MTDISQQDRSLLEAAVARARNAYVLWGFLVGATVLAEDNRIYEGCNVESWISSLVARAMLPA